MSHNAPQTQLPVVAEAATDPQICPRCHPRWPRPAVRRGLCINHARVADNMEELAFFEGFHASDERTGEWMGVGKDAIERARQRRKAQR